MRDILVVLGPRRPTGSIDSLLLSTPPALREIGKDTTEVVPGPQEGVSSRPRTGSGVLPLDLSRPEATQTVGSPPV